MIPQDAAMVNRGKYQNLTSWYENVMFDEFCLGFSADVYVLP